MDAPSLHDTLRNARAALLAERLPHGHWEGELSTSALSTATAIVALHAVEAKKHEPMIRGGAEWLIANQNRDGGWGDTVLSFSNISTTLLCWSALSRVRPDATDAISRAGGWIGSYAGGTDVATIVHKVKERYGKDRTFSVPILMMCAICGRLGDRHGGWDNVLPLPFELAAFPREWFAALQLPVVSYALPALIAIGYGRFYHAPPPWPLSAFRKAIWPKTSALLTQIQPGSGGFLEAAPLTSFVTMALASSGQAKHPVAQNGVRFLIDTVRPDGSWPIDTNLATWTTTLATKALLEADRADFPPEDQCRVLDWLTGQQYRVIHPFTNAAPGGWAWTDLSGGVPDADDTPGALLALRKLSKPTPELIDAAEAAIVWLLDLQNRDGGIPTFCRGWGALPFDRSSPDLTAHTLRAWHAWKDDVASPIRARMDRGAEMALAYLAREQDADGAWTPLWFGNQHVAAENNRAYGTAKVVRALGDIQGWDPASERLRPGGENWLFAQQNKDGGWSGELGAPSSIEETALVLDALAPTRRPELQRGVHWLIEATRRGTEFPASPIGFYFAKLWYFEKLYPKVWTVSALERIARFNP